MSEWSNKEVARLKELMATKRVKDEKSVQGYNTKQAKGLGFWESTKSAAKRLVDEINEKVSNGLILWDGEKYEVFRITATGFKPNTYVTATYNEKAFSLKYTQPPHNSSTELNLFAEDDGQVFWRKPSGDENLTAEQGAELIVGVLTTALKV